MDFSALCFNGGIATVFKGGVGGPCPRILTVCLLRTDWIYMALKMAFLGAHGVADRDSDHL